MFSSAKEGIHIDEIFMQIVMDLCKKKNVKQLQTEDKERRSTVLDKSKLPKEVKKKCSC